MAHHVGGLLVWPTPAIDSMNRWVALWTGVDLFFAISGFVIARDILQRLDRATTHEQFWRESIAFWIKRVYRIWPSAWIWMFTIFVLSVLLKNTGLFAPPRTNFYDFTAVVMQVYNFHMYACMAHQPSGVCGNGFPWWSLSLEEQFYIALPIAAFLFRKRLPYFLAFVILVQIFLHRAPQTQPFLWVIRTDALCLGVLLAMLERTAMYKMLQPTFMDKRGYAIPAVVLLIVLLGALPEDVGTGKLVIAPFTTGLVAVVSVLLVFIASFDRDYIVRNRFLKPLFLWVGSRSYALYLIHFPAILLAQYFWRCAEPAGTVFHSNYTLRFLLVWIAMTAALSELNYRFVETPLRKKGRAVAQRFLSENSAATEFVDIRTKQRPEQQQRSPLSSRSQ